MDADTMREFVADIGAESDRLTRMAQKLLTLSRASADETEGGEHEVVASGRRSRACSVCSCRWPTGSRSS